MVRAQVLRARENSRETPNQEHKKVFHDIYVVGFVMVKV